jgi:hypothetical protein
MLVVGLMLARDMLDVVLPPIVAGECGRDRTAHVLATRVARRMMSDRTDPAGPLERIPFAMAVRHRGREKQLYIANRIRNMLTPDALDVQWVRMPRGLSFLYYLLRPIRRMVGLAALVRKAGKA